MTNSQVLQQKQNNSLIQHAKNQDEANFVFAFENKLKVYEHSDKLIDTLAKWRWMAGINNSNQDENEIAKELALLCQFVVDNYSLLTIDEINLAINLSLTNKLDCDVNAYNSFTPAYVSRILNSYASYKRELFNSLSERKERFEYTKELESKPTAQQKMDGMVELINYLYEGFKESGEVVDHFNSLYNYLRSTNRLNPSKELINDALAYAEIKTKEHITNYFADAIGQHKINDEYIKKRFARNYCVKDYFEKNSIDNIIASVNINDFN